MNECSRGFLGLMDVEVIYSIGQFLEDIKVHKCTAIYNSIKAIYNQYD